MGGARRGGPLAALSLLGAGAGWGAFTGAAAGAPAAFLSGSEPHPADVPAAVMLGLLFGGPTGLLLGLCLSLIPAVAVAFATSRRQARVAAAVAYVPGAALMVAWLLRDVGSASIGYAALYAGALLFGLWRCQRSAAVAARRVEQRRAAPPVQRPGVPLEEPSL